MSLEEIADFRNGKAISPERYSEDGQYPVFGANGQIARSDDVLNTEAVVVIGRVGAYCGSVHYIPEPSWVTDNAIVATAKSGNDVRFLYYLFYYLELRRTAIGSAQPLITQGGLKVVQTVVPPLKEQQAIACILGALDDKIELNRRMNQTLEAIARAIFKSWFVDFDPVRAKAARRQPPGLAPHIAELFPDSFVNSELGEIQRGWRIGFVSEFGEIVCGKTPPTSNPENYGSDIPFITIPDMHGKVFVTRTNKSLSLIGAETQPTKTLPPFSVLVSCIATPGIVAITTKPSQTNQQINSIVPSCDKSPFYVYFALRELTNEIIARASGGSVTLNLNKAQFSNLQTIIPSTELVKAYHKAVEPVFFYLLSNEEQSHTLTQIRDALLPKLISGELRVPDAERIVGRCI
jgi:type I restriction enzyme S subunit